MSPVGGPEPSVLFLSNANGPERKYGVHLYRELRRDGYNLYVDPTVCGFRMVFVLRKAGFEPVQILTSDINLFSSIVGTMLAGRHPRELGMQVDGEPMDLPDDPLMAATRALWIQAKLRFTRFRDSPYWNDLRENIDVGQERHEASIYHKLTQMLDALKGINYEPCDCFLQIDRHRENPRAIIYLELPTYKGGYERFYSTGGRLTWNEPEYTLIDPRTILEDTMEDVKDAQALVIFWQQRKTGRPVGEPFYARQVNDGETVYLVANRTDEIRQLIGVHASGKKGSGIRSLNYPMIGPDEELTPDMPIDIMPMSGEEALYYRDLLLHKINYKPAGTDLAVIVGGKLVAIMGYNALALSGRYTGPVDEALGAVYGVGPKHNRYRLTRLAIALWPLRSNVRFCVNDWLGARCKGVTTREFTRNPESKLMRGSGFRLIQRVRDPVVGYQLVYYRDLDDRTPQEVYTEWLEKEKTRSATTSTASAPASKRSRRRAQPQPAESASPSTEV